MFRGLRVDSACSTAALLVVVLPMWKVMGSGGGEYREASSCGHIHNISHPFRLGSDPPSWGKHTYELVCENNVTLVLYLNSIKYYVQAINYNDHTIRLVDAGVLAGRDQYCPSFPPYPLTRHNFSFRGPYMLRGRSLTLINCGKRMKFSDDDDDGCVKYSSCINKSSSSSNSPTARGSGGVQYAYVKVGYLNASDLMGSCRIDGTWTTALGFEGDVISSLADLHAALVYGFELFWGPSFRRIACPALSDFTSRVFYYFPVKANLRGFRWLLYPLLPISFASGWLVHPGTPDGSSRCGAKDILIYVALWVGIVSIYVIELNIALRVVVCIPFVLTILIQKLRTRHLSMFDDIEAYLQSQNNLVPIRYSYTQIKQMTRGFKDKLGEGGYGCVYKGKLRSGTFVAVKILGKTKANGQEFINEVATIGRIHHANVVKLIGYCAERSKRALVYDFMPNGSLDKYIFPRDDETLSLSCEKLYQISIGVARGIEYLHRGCDIQILHFDIKPHNILLDESFTPKVSDFGLAKLYPTDDSIVSLTAARGTIGYMAPELLYKNIGGVSYKADVYSFGMLLLEMGGRRKNLNAFVDHTSQIYFPSWAHSQISKGKDIEMGDATGEEREIVKKMIIVALWCIQTKPADRPSMHKVVEMLEGDIEVLQMPPKPNLCPDEMPDAEISEGANAQLLIDESINSIDSITLDIISA